jgi:hypothetical protein
VPCCLSGTVAVVSKMQGDADGSILSLQASRRMCDISATGLEPMRGLRRATCILGVEYVRRFLRRADRAGCK